ncbi:hypothetical protein AAHA92_10688 [Salvia divinorum]|uniref:Uncharacterized protein n=1 Tax=Salvia divinorum TaxID=28513 RepID=A0ABD1HYZ8_SALDI
MFSNDSVVVYLGSSCSLLVIDRGNKVPQLWGGTTEPSEDEQKNKTRNNSIFISASPVQTYYEQSSETVE